MSKKFISFLGTNKYTMCNYTYKKNKIENVHFVQEALIKIFCKDFSESDKIIIFLTEKAKELNWNDSDKIGLKSTLRNCCNENSVSTVDIPDGNSESELWEIFNLVYEQFDEGDVITYDITHSFRSLPMLGIVLMNYAKFLKNVRISGIYYGAFESIGTVKDVEKMIPQDRNAPIFNLTNFSKLQEWSSAADHFVKLGSADKLIEMIKETNKPIWADSRGTDPQSKQLNKMTGLLEKIVLMFSTVRGKEIFTGSEFKDLNDILTNLKITYHRLKPLAPIIERISQKIENFEKNDIMNGFRAVQWCIEHRLIQQGITLLQENIITYFLDRLKLDWSNKEYREIFSSAIHIINKEIPCTRWKGKAGENTDVTCKIVTAGLPKSILKNFDKLRALRNDINHGGFTEPRSADKFSRKLIIIFNDIKSEMNIA